MGVHILALNGELDLQSSVKLETSFHELIGANKTCILLDMEKVCYLDSTGLGTLIQGVQALQNRGGTLKLSNVSASIMKMFRMVELLDYLEIHRDTGEAMAAFGRRASLPRHSFTSARPKVPWVNRAESSPSRASLPAH